MKFTKQHMIVELVLLGVFAGLWGLMAMFYKAL